MSPPHDIATPFEAVAPAPVAAPTSTAAADATVAAHPLKAKAQAVSNNKDDGLIAEPASPAGILAVLSRTSPFSTLNPEHLVKVASLVQPVKLGKGTQVYEEGSSQSAMIIVVQGTLQVVKNGKLAGQLSPYDSIGFRNLFGDAPAPATLIASEAASCFTLSIERKDFAPLLAREPTLALALLPALAAHMPDAAAVATHTNTVALESATSAAIAATIEAGLPRERSKFVVRVFDAKAYQTAAFLEQNARP
ncbi:cyclic nucleotide-binding-like protein, partial [Blastocladiella britannica]